ncbi:Ribonuclease [Planctomycetes bacterium Poly30]|uniref:Ribonuclease n=1 Tax=Saltatorellus ferox TaxID=2528018 RepID=A0A518EL26_9BACT|nr:Ribonuclease [Planctomycetes bacterium Poly30]
MDITFLGAAGTVTGSRHLVESNGSRVLVDCGLFQGYKVLRERNWKPLPFDPSSLDAVILTHAHVDHSGYLPALVRDGFKGRIYTTQGTRELCEILLLDSAHIHEADARFANKTQTTKHEPALPLYTVEDAENVNEHWHVVERHQETRIGGFVATFSEAGHILGASSVLLSDGQTKVLFSGDLGRDHDVLMRPPEPPPAADWVVMESTYGDRVQENLDPLEEIAEPLRQCLERGGVALVPAFAVGRTQALLYILHELFESGRLPRVPVHVDSPMADRVTEVYTRHADEYCLDEQQCKAGYAVASFSRSRDDSKALDQPGAARIIISAAGMLSGGRVLHHLKVFGPHRNNLILLPGFQAPGTRGAALVNGERELRVHGKYLLIEAEVHQTSILSAHADQKELLAWLGRIPAPPRGVVLVHGEPESLDSLRKRIGEDLKMNARVADAGETISLA